MLAFQRPLFLGFLSVMSMERDSAEYGAGALWAPLSADRAGRRD